MNVAPAARAPAWCRKRRREPPVGVGPAIVATVSIFVGDEGSVMASLL